MTEPAWVGIDLGTQSVRAVALDDHGAVLGSASEALASVRDDGRHEQDPRQWLAATASALQATTALLPARVRVAAVAVSGTSGTVVPVDAVSGSPRGPAVMYDDRRGSPHLDLVAAAGAELWDRLGYRMQATWALPKILDLLHSGALPEGAVLAHQPDVITAMLAGRLLRSDLSSALKSGADLDAVAWPERLLDSLGLPVDRLNGLAASGTSIGSVSAEGAELTGLPDGCRIVAGTTDGCAAQISAGALRTGDWNSVLGTTLVMKGVSPTRLPDVSGAIYAHRAPFTGGWYPGGASSTGAGAISALLPGRDLANLTARFDAEAPPPVAYPLIGRGERFPFVAAEAAGILPVGDDDAIFSAILHGVACVERLAFDLIGSAGYHLDGRLLLTGGGARNHAWNQLRADTLQREVHIPVQTEGAAGMAVLAAAGHAAEHNDGDPLVNAAARLVGPATAVEPRASRASALLEAYTRFLDQLDDRSWLPAPLSTAARARLP